LLDRKTKLKRHCFDITEARSGYGAGHILLGLALFTANPHIFNAEHRKFSTKEYIYIQLVNALVQYWRKTKAQYFRYKTLEIFLKGRVLHDIYVCSLPASWRSVIGQIERKPSQ
jgi:hypothetical protein